MSARPAWWAPKTRSKSARLTPAVIRRARALYQDPGVPMRDLVALTGLGRDSVVTLMRRLGVPLRPVGRPRRVLTAAEARDFRAWWAAGRGVAWIAVQLRMSTSMAWRLVREWGLSRGEEPPARTAPREARRRCEACLAVFPLRQDACPNGHAAPEVA